MMAWKTSTPFYLPSKRYRFLFTDVRRFFIGNVKLLSPQHLSLCIHIWSGERWNCGERSSFLQYSYHSFRRSLSSLVLFAVRPGIERQIWRPSDFSKAAEKLFQDGNARADSKFRRVICQTACVLGSKMVCAIEEKDIPPPPKHQL